MNTHTTENYYTILQLTQDATPEEIKLAYLDMAGVWHPDRFTNSPRLLAKANEAMKRINTAYETLKNPDKRRQYDSALKQSTASTSHPETRRRPRKSEERPQSNKSTDSARPSEPSSETLEQTRKNAVKHVKRWLELVELVSSVQRRFGIVISVPPLLVEGTDTALERVQMAGYHTIVELTDDADIKYNLLVTHVNRVLEQTYKRNVQALQAAQSKVNQEQQDTKSALNKVRETYANQMKMSKRDCDSREHTLSMSTAIVTILLSILLFVGFAFQANIVIEIVCGLCILSCIPCHLYGVRRVNTDYEYIKARANVRSRLESEELVRQASFRLLNDEVTLRAAEDQVWLIHEVKGILKNL